MSDNPTKAQKVPRGNGSPFRRPLSKEGNPMVEIVCPGADPVNVLKCRSIARSEIYGINRLILRGLKGCGRVAQIRAALAERCRVASRLRRRPKNCQLNCCASMHNPLRRTHCVMRQIFSRAEV